jgi:signal transduction histidine kinase
MEELKKESCISLSAPEYAKPSQTAVQKAIKYGSIEKFRKICLTKSGLPINASMSLSYLKSRDEIVMITSDITQDIQYQEELERQIEQEVGKRTEQYEVMCHQSRLAAMGEMINSIAHQWRQPLNGLGIIVQGLRHIANQDNVDKTMIKEVEDEIMEKVKYMSQTIDDFSTFFKMSKKKVAFDIIGSIHDAIRLIDVQLRVSNIEVSVDSKELQTLELLGFPNEFRQVILNMIHNSINAIEQNNINQGKINIITQEIADKICIKIHDNGGGIPKDSMENIFDPYFTTKEKGSGIGLYMSKIIIEHHMNGSLSVSNHKDGAEFTIEFQKGVLS